MRKSVCRELVRAYRGSKCDGPVHVILGAEVLRQPQRYSPAERVPNNKALHIIFNKPVCQTDGCTVRIPYRFPPEID